MPGMPCPSLPCLPKLNCHTRQRCASTRQGQPEGALCAVQVLVEKARVEAEEAQRILLAALNGLAGLMILDSDRPQAVTLYRKVTTSPEHAGQQPHPQVRQLLSVLLQVELPMHLMCRCRADARYHAGKAESF